MKDIYNHAIIGYVSTQFFLKQHTHTLFFGRLLIVISYPTCYITKNDLSKPRISKSTSMPPVLVLQSSSNGFSTWRDDPSTGMLVNPKFISHTKATWKGSHNQILRGDLLTMVTNHLCPSWDDPPSRDPPTSTWFQTPPVSPPPFQKHVTHTKKT